MSESPSSGNAPSADELKDRVETQAEQQNLGVGEEEPDPVTAEDPPSDTKAGDQKREPT
jgi:hypothetical protein